MRTASRELPTSGTAQFCAAVRFSVIVSHVSRLVLGETASPRNTSAA
jgi:hypothetical protein